MKRTKLYTEEEKRSIIEEYINTAESSRSLGERYGINGSTIRIWAKQLNHCIIMSKKPSERAQTAAGASKNESDLLLEIKRLKKALEYSQLETEFYKEVIKVAEQDLGHSIKKKVQHRAIMNLIKDKPRRLGRLSMIAGLSRQAVYQFKNERIKVEYCEELICQKVLELRSVHKKVGLRKMLPSLLLFTQSIGIKLGRDHLYKILNNNNLLVYKTRSNKPITTMSKHRYKLYPNILKDLFPNGPNQVWVSDITYVGHKNRFYYLSLITDMYSRKILGYSFDTDLKASGAVCALHMALKSTGGKDLSCLIHHSDRGVQYCCNEYIALLKNNRIRISMTEKGDPLENPIAERVNGIIKGEYDLEKINKLSKLKSDLTSAIFHYNNYRPHSSINDLNPSQAHTMSGHIDRLWRSKRYHPAQ